MTEGFRKPSDVHDVRAVSYQRGMDLGRVLFRSVHGATKADIKRKILKSIGGVAIRRTNRLRIVSPRTAESDVQTITCC